MLEPEANAPPPHAAILPRRTRRRRPAFRAAVGRGAEVVAAGGAVAHRHPLSLPPPSPPTARGTDRAKPGEQPVRNRELKGEARRHRLNGDRARPLPADAAAILRIRRSLVLRRVPRIALTLLAKNRVGDPAS